MRESLKRWPWYAAVLAAYPLLYIAVTNPGQVAAADVMPVVAAGILAAVGLVALVRPFVGNWAAAGLGAAWVILLFYLYGPVNRVVARLGAEQSGEEQAAERTLVSRLSAARAFGLPGSLHCARGHCTIRPHRGPDAARS